MRLFMPKRLWPKLPRREIAVSGHSDQIERQAAGFNAKAQHAAHQGDTRSQAHRNEFVSNGLLLFDLPILSKHIPARGRKWLTFVAAGAPSLLVAIPLNVFLVKYVQLSMALAYAIVIMLQLIVNFVVCRQLVFDRNPTGNVWREFTLYVSGISVLRLCDWVVYNVFVSYLEWNFIAVQVLNICLFSALKFLYSERIFQAEKAGEGS